MDRFAVISDIHGNLHALEAVFARIGELDVQGIVCLGDIVGYGPFPGRCIDLVVKHCCSIIQGNHDEAVINPQCEAGFNGPAKDAVVWTRSVLGPLHLDALSRLKSVDHPHASVMCIHACPVDMPTDYVHDARMAALAFAGVDRSICLLCHTHVPVVFEAPRRTLVDGSITSIAAHELISYIPRNEASVALDRDKRYICNPGSVGQPRDADPRASFAVLDLARNTFTVYRQEYDITAVQLATQNVGLPTILAERLAVGA